MFKRPVRTEEMQEHRRKQKRPPSNKRIVRQDPPVPETPSLRIVTVEEKSIPEVLPVVPAESPSFLSYLPSQDQVISFLKLLLHGFRAGVRLFIQLIGMMILGTIWLIVRARQEFVRGKIWLTRYLEGWSPTTTVAREIQLAHAEARAATAVRLSSLDAFRGLTILAMLLVNNATQGMVTENLTHADWSGSIHIADLVFPYFLFIGGVAIPYSWASHRRSGRPLWQYLLRAVRRTVILILLGWLIDSTVSRQLTLDLGVLQLIGLAYLVGALMVHVRPLRRLMVAAALLILHWVLIRFVPIPEIGAGHFTATENIISYINDTYLQQFGLKGLISVIPTAAMVLIGSVIGELLRRENYIRARKLPVLAAGGILLLLIGFAWSAILPFNKPLWTASYILFTAGGAILVLGLFYALIDIQGWRALAFALIVPGMNPIILYVGSILFKINILQTWHIYRGVKNNPILEYAMQENLRNTFGRTAGGWAYTLGYIVFWWLILFYLYRKQIFLRV